MEKRKLTETVTGDDGTLDLISKLPESLLVRIISLLPTTKEACRTSLVSKRWQYLWTAIDNLSFTYTYTNELGAQKFVSVVDYVFSKRTCSKIKNFYIDFWEMPSYNLHIQKWLSHVIKCKVEHVIFKSVYLEMYSLPQFFYTCSSLVTLDLSNCAFRKTAVISWKSLKTAKFDTVVLSNESIVKLLSGCPALETLELTSFYRFRRLEINNPNLKRLKLEDSWPVYERGHSLEIVAPHLQHLQISGELDDFKCRLLNVSSLVSAELTFDISCVNGILDVVEYHYSDSCRDYHHVYWTLVQDYLQKLRHVRELTIGSWFAEVIFMLHLDGVQLPEMKCICLTLKFHITKYNLYGVAILLQASPHVEILNINMESYHICSHCYYESSNLRKGDDTDLESWISNIVFPNLKNVKIVYSTGMCGERLYDDKLFELSEFLLKNAMVLEKFVVVAKRSKCWNCSENCVSPYLLRMTAKLLVCPRPSTNFEITFRESDFDD